LKNASLFLLVYGLLACNFKPAIAQLQDQENDCGPAPIVIRHTPKLSPAIIDLSKVQCFDGRYTGAGGGQSLDFRLYENVSSHGSRSLSEFEWLLDKGTPAARLYAAMLIKDIDPSAGKQALRKLTLDHDQVVFRFVGCLKSEGTVSEIAWSLLMAEKSPLEKIDFNKLNAENKNLKTKSVPQK
jgi:hypothetical protein